MPEAPWSEAGLVLWGVRLPRPLLALSLIVACASSDPATDPGLTDAKHGDLAAQLDAAVQEMDLVGAAMAIVDLDQGTEWAGASGLARVETDEAWEPGRLVRIGSTTKTFTAALIFLLEEEGVLTLDDPIEQWAPGYYDGVGITLRHLLSNTSGIVSYNYVGPFDESSPWEPEELAQWAVDHEPELRFEPGAEWEYSNTNFVLLGLVIEAATGNNYADEVESRLLEPLGLDDTYIAGSGDKNPALVDCYARNGDNLSGTSDPSYGWAAGAGVSTPTDLARWTAALYGGDVLSADSLTRMTTPTELADGTVTDYGLGSFVELDEEHALFGHTGGIAGFQTYMYYWQTNRIALVVTTNTFDTNLRDLSAYGWSVLLDLSALE